MWSWLWFPIALVLAVSLGLGVTYVVLSNRGRVPSPNSSTSSGSRAPTATPTAMANQDITASASSTLPSSGKLYLPSRTIDGKPVTAWNSHGKKVGANAKVTLRWTFASPVRIARVEVFNGYQKDQRRFDANGRLRSVRVVTETGEKVVELADRMGPQRVTVDSGPTSFVEIQGGIGLPEQGDLQGSCPLGGAVLRHAPVSHVRAAQMTTACVWAPAADEYPRMANQPWSIWPAIRVLGAVVSRSTPSAGGPTTGGTPNAVPSSPAPPPSGISPGRAAGYDLHRA